MNQPSPVIQHDPAHQRFTTQVEGHDARLDYEFEAGLFVITHTLVPRPIGGRGIAAALVQAVFEYAWAAGFKVRPVCSYADVWARRHHAQVADLLA